MNAPRGASLSNNGIDHQTTLGLDGHRRAPVRRRATMKAVIHSRYGNPEVLQVTTLERQVPQKLRASGGIGPFLA
ncbi:MAG: hypothetical protein IV094_03535 [Vitreoscilla sp.]|nr:hypothetical protein [Vitreoscilla sp.]